MASSIVFSAKMVEDLRDFSGVPVLNGLDRRRPPYSGMADFLYRDGDVAKPLSKMKLVYVGDGRNNVANALMIGAAKVGMDYTVAAPKQLFPSQALLDELSPVASATGSVISCTADPYEAVKGADIIYTDVWVSMGRKKDVRTDRSSQTVWLRWISSKPGNDL
jgi:ornithine carbamoyltransferase